MSALALIFAAALTQAVSGPERTGPEVNPAPVCLDLAALNARASRLAPDVATASARLDGAEADFDDALALRRPQISLFARSGVGDSGLTSSSIENQIGLRVSQRLIDFGDARLARESARSTRRAAAHEVRAAALQAGLDVVLLAIDRLETRASLEATLARADYFRSQTETVSVMADQGMATGAELAEVSAELARSEADRIALEFQRDRIEAALQVRLEDEAPRLCDEPRMAADLDQALGQAGTIAVIADQAVRRNRELAALRESVAASEARRRREGRARLPAIEAVGVSSYAYDDARDAWDYRDRIGIDVSVPLYSGSQLSARADRAAAEADLTAAQLRQRERQVREEALITQRRISALRGQVIRLETVRIRKAEQLALVEQEVERSVATLPELVDVRLEHENAVLAEIRARHDLYREQARLLALADAAPGTLQAPEPSQRTQLWGWEPDPED